MKQQSDENPMSNPGKSTVDRVYTSKLVQIGQVWQRRQRGRDKPTFRIYQVHRHRREVYLVPAGFTGSPTGRDMTRVSFTDLGRRYRLLLEAESDKTG